MNIKAILIVLLLLTHLNLAKANSNLTFDPWSYQVTCRVSYLYFDTERDRIADVDEHVLFADMVKNEESNFANATLENSEGSQKVKININFSEWNGDNQIFAIDLTHFLNNKVQANLSTYSSSYSKLVENSRFIHINLDFKNQEIINAIENQQPGEDLTVLTAAKKLYPNQKLVPWSLETNCTTSTIKAKVID